MIARGDVQGPISLARAAMARHGQLPTLLMWYGRALGGAGEYEEAWEVLNRVFAAGPGLDDPRNVTWAQAEIAVQVLGLAHLRGDQVRAAELEAAVLAVIEFVARDWPWGAEERMFFLDGAMQRYDAAASRLRTLGPRIDPSFIHFIEHIELFRPLGETAEGRVFFEEMQQELARQLERLRASDIPWLLAPEQWVPR